MTEERERAVKLLALQIVESSHEPRNAGSLEKLGKAKKQFLP